MNEEILYEGRIMSVVEMRKNGRTYQSIADELNVSRQYIEQIIKRALFKSNAPVKVTKKLLEEKCRVEQRIIRKNAKIDSLKIEISMLENEISSLEKQLTFFPEELFATEEEMKKSS